MVMKQSTRNATIGVVVFMVLVVFLSMLFGPKATSLTNMPELHEQNWLERLLNFQAYNLAGPTFLNPGQTEVFTFYLDGGTNCGGVAADVDWQVGFADVDVLFQPGPDQSGCAGGYCSKAKITFPDPGTFFVRVEYSCWKGSGSEQFKVTVADECTSQCVANEERCYDNKKAYQDCFVTDGCGTWGAVRYCRVNEECEKSGDDASCVSSTASECNVGDIYCVGHFGYVECEWFGGAFLWNDESVKDLRPLGRVCVNDVIHVGECVDDNECGSGGDCVNYQCVDGAPVDPGDKPVTTTTVTGGTTTTTPSGQTTTTVAGDGGPEPCTKTQELNDEGECVFSFEQLWENYKMPLILGVVVFILVLFMGGTGPGKKVAKKSAAVVVNVGKTTANTAKKVVRK